MKTQFITLLLLLSASLSQAQISFQHVTSATNAVGMLTRLDHPQLNSNPNAVVFVSPVFQDKGDLNLVYPVGLKYENNRWGIFQQTGYDIPASESPRLRFNVLVYPKANNDVFVHTVIAGNKSGHTTILNHPQLNGNPNAVLLVTQRFGTYNNHEIGVWYNGSRWTIFNQDRIEMPGAAQFNVLIVSAGKAPGLPNSVAFTHTHNEASKLNTSPPNPGYTVLNHPTLNRINNRQLFVTQRFTNQYNPHSYNIWYDRPNDEFTNHKDGYWMVYNSQNEPLPVGASFNIVAVPFGEPVETPLYGFVDMHTHPMSQFAFGGEFFFGMNDGKIANSLGDCSCFHNYRFDALGNCMNKVRNSFVDVLDPHEKGSGYPDFRRWPTHQSKLHQQMWHEWIKRTYDSGLRVMVALAHNSHCLADASESTKTPCDDLGSMNVQIDSMIAFVGRHSFMEIARNSTDLRRIVSNNKLAIVLGVEMDHIGNFYRPADPKNAQYNPQPTDYDIVREVDRLWSKGVRYFFPVHLNDNIFGGAAVYGEPFEKALFNIANKYNTGTAYALEETPSVGWVALNENDREIIGQLNKTYGDCADILKPDFIPCQLIRPDLYPIPQDGMGHRNRKGLTQQGRFLIQYLMKKGMLIDIDHMSEKMVLEVLNMGLQADYPLNSGHNGPRGKTGSENARTDAQYRNVIQTGGMIGLGHGGEASIFKNGMHYLDSLIGPRNLAIGTDVNIVPLPGPPASSARLQRDINLGVCRTGTANWNFESYNKSGVSHYGLLPEYFQSVSQAGWKPNVKDVFYHGAEFFAQMWKKSEQRARTLATGSFTFTPAPVATRCPTRKVQGDAEFGGGPLMNCMVRLEVSSDRRTLNAIISFKAEETKGDRSTVEQTWTQQLWEAPNGMQISQINTDVSSSVINYRGTNAGWEGGGCNDGSILSPPLSGNLLSKMDLIGDTGGDDISSDADCSCDTQIRSITFRPITLTLSTLNN